MNNASAMTINATNCLRLLKAKKLYLDAIKISRKNQNRLHSTLFLYQNCKPVEYYILKDFYGENACSLKGLQIFTLLPSDYPKKY